MVGIIYCERIEEIKSVAEVVEKVSNHLKNNAPDNIDLKFYYRGHSNIDYALCPSIARYRHNIGVELSLIEAANYKMPDEFNKDGDLLTTLAKMQHYGLPTRLIDFTTNPLVALYFACQEKNVDGEVIELNNHILKQRYGISSYTSLMIKPELLKAQSVSNIDVMLSN